MKRTILLLAVAFIATTSFAFAQNNQNPASRQKQKTCFVDIDSNGICDKYESGDCKTGTGKGERLRDGSGRKNGKGRGCNAGKGLRDGSGYANNGRKANYVDANNNDICDNREAVKSE